MRIGLIGNGTMGKMLKQRIPEHGHQLVSVFDSSNRLRADKVSAVDMLIDFSIAAALCESVEFACAANIPLVTGTTGWEYQKEKIKAICLEQGGSMLFAPNFAIGVLLFNKVAAYAAHLFSGLPNYDVAIHEIHHRNKADAPSGTALMLSEAVRQANPHKTTVQAGNPPGKINSHSLHISSSRVGEVPGTHQVFIDGSSDHIQLMHLARGRTAFADGAIMAAEWLQGKTGFFSIQHMLSEKFDRKID